GGGDAAAPAAPERAWLELAVVDEHGEPLAHEPFELDLPDGSTRSGALDGRGEARADDLPPGRCRVRFPRRAAQEPVAPPGPAESAPAWLELAALDAAGAPLAGERYVLALPDGSRRAGSLDERGEARLEGLPAGACRVRFPDREPAGDEPLAAAPLSAAA